MDVAVVKGVIILGPRSDPAGLAILRETEIQKVRNSRRRGGVLVALMIANRGPQYRLAKFVSIDIKNGPLILLIGPAVISVVAEHEPNIRGSRAGKGLVGVTHADSM